MSKEVLRVIKAMCVHYNLVESEAHEVCGIDVVKSVKSVKSEKSEVPLPYNGSVNLLNCVALRKNHGLYTQCEGKKEKDVEYCKSCDKKMKKMGSELPEYGTIMSRSEVGKMEYVDPLGGKVIHYTKVMKKLKLSREVVEEEAKKMGIEIEECHFLEEASKRGRPKGEEKVKKEGKKGRPKKEKTLIEEVEEEDPEDLFAKLVLEASKEVAEEAMSEAISEAMDELVVDEEVSDENVVYEVVVDENKEVSELETVVHKAIKDATVRREAKQVVSKEEREAKKEAERVAKEAKKEAERLAKEAKKEEERVAKEAKKEADRLAKEAAKEVKKEVERIAKEAAKEVKKEMERLAKEALKSEKASEKVKKPKADKKVAEVAEVAEVEVAKVEEVAEVAKVEEVAEVAEIEVAKVEEVAEEADVVKKIKFEGKQYLKSKKSGIVYDYELYVSTGDQVMVGMWNEEKKCIMFKSVDSDSEEESEEECEEEYEE
jgi:hypothetical protein